MELSFPHEATWLYDVVVVHVQAGEGLSGLVCNPITELAVVSRDKSTLFTINDVVY